MTVQPSGAVAIILLSIPVMAVATGATFFLFGGDVPKTSLHSPDETPSTPTPDPDPVEHNCSTPKPTETIDVESELVGHDLPPVNGKWYV